MPGRRAVLIRETLQVGLEVLPQYPVHHAARTIAAHDVDEAVTGQVGGADKSALLVVVQSALAVLRSTLGLDGGFVGGLHGT